MISMKKTLISLIAYIAFSASPALSETADGFCEASDDGSTVGADLTCKVTPSQLTFKIYEVGICTADATPADKSSCTAVFTNTTGLDINLTAGGNIPLNPEVSLTEGQYNYGYMLVGTTQKIKISQTFTGTARQSSSGENAGAAIKAVDGSSNPIEGLVCVSNGTTFGDNDSVTCGAAGTVPTAANNMNQVLGDHSVKYAYDTATFSVPGETSTTTKIWVLNSDQAAITTQDYTVVGGGNNAFTGWSGTPDRPYNFAVQALSPQMNITPTTANINIKFVVTGAGAIDFWPSTEATCVSCLRDLTFEGMKFQFTAD